MKKYIVIALLIVLGMAYPVYARWAVCAVGGSITAAACNPASNETGDRTEHAGGTNLANNVVQCMLYTPDCYGTFGTAYAKGGYSGDDVKVCVYLDDGDNVPDDGDTKVGCSAGDSVVSEGDWQTLTTKIGGTAVNPNKYWVCTIGGTDGFYIRRTTSGSRTGYDKSSFSYSSPPATLTGAWTSGGSTDYAMYVEME